MPYSKVSPGNKPSGNKMPVNTEKKGIETKSHVPKVTQNTLINSKIK